MRAGLSRQISLPRRSLLLRAIGGLLGRTGALLRVRLGRTLGRLRGGRLLRSLLCRCHFRGSFDYWYPALTCATAPLGTQKESRRDTSSSRIEMNPQSYSRQRDSSTSKNQVASIIQWSRQCIWSRQGERIEATCVLRSQGEFEQKESFVEISTPRRDNCAALFSPLAEQRTCGCSYFELRAGGAADDVETS